MVSSLKSLHVTSLLLVLAITFKIGAPSLRAQDQSNSSEAGGGHLANMISVGSLDDRESLTKMTQDSDRQIASIASLRLFLTDPMIEKVLGVTKLGISRKPLSQYYGYPGVGNPPQEQLS